MTMLPMTGRSTTHDQPRRRRVGRALRWVPVLALAAFIAASCSSTKHTTDSGTVADSSGNSSSSAGTTKVEFGQVSVQGDVLASMPSSGTDPAVGKAAPTVVGQRFDGSKITLAANGKPTVIFFLAHWCPHCNREVPALLDYWKTNPVPAGVQLLSVTTGSNENYPNWPPSQWVVNLHWPVPVLADSQNQDAARAFGLPAYPYFVMLKPDGTVFFRNSGEWPASEFAAKVAQLVQASKS